MTGGSERAGTRTAAAPGADDLDPALVDVAEVTMQVNLARSATRLVPEIRQELEPLVA